MTDHSKAARELYEYAHAEFPACGIAVVPWDDVPEVIRNAWRRALEQAESDALERAAVACESRALELQAVKSSGPEQLASLLGGAFELRELAARLRSMKP